MEQKFYICNVCKKIVGIVNQGGGKLVCCGQEMQEIIPGTTDASKEKHVPQIEVNGNIVKVSVGSVTHPMEEKHYIEWISLQTKQGNQRKALSWSDKPEVTFAITEGDEVMAAYAYCNLHGLWKTNF